MFLSMILFNKQINKKKYMKVLHLRPVVWKSRKPWKVFEHTPKSTSAEIVKVDKPFRPSVKQGGFLPVHVTIYNQGQTPELFDLARSKLTLSLLSENLNLCLQTWSTETLFATASPLWQKQVDPSTTIFLAFPVEEGRAGVSHSNRNLWSLISKVEELSIDPEEKKKNCKLVAKGLEQTISYQQRQVTGFVIATKVRKNKIPTLELVLVCSAGKGTEVGTSLLRAVEKFAHEEKYKELKVDALSGVVEFYKSFGFSRQQQTASKLIRMKKSIYI